MPRSAKASSNAFDAAGDGGMGAPSGMSSAISLASRSPTPHQVVVDEQRRLARAGRALERRGGNADDDPPTAELVQDVASSERPGHGIELVTYLVQAGGRRWVQVGAKPHARLDDVAVRMTYCLGGGTPEHHIELGEAEHEAVGLVDQDDVEVIAQLLRQACSQLQAAESGTQYQYSHR